MERNATLAQVVDSQQDDLQQDEIALDEHWKSLFPKGPKSTFQSFEKIATFYNNHDITLYEFI